MRQILAELKSILDSLSDPTLLDGEEIAFLNARWILSLSQLKETTPKSHALSSGEKEEFKMLLTEMMARMPVVQSILTDQKSVVASQLYSENRRVKVIHQGGYGASIGRNHLIRHMA